MSVSVSVSSSSFNRIWRPKSTPEDEFLNAVTIENVGAANQRARWDSASRYQYSGGKAAIDGPYLMVSEV